MALMSSIESSAAASQPISVLMISLDPGLLSSHAGSGDVMERHLAYAARVGSLDIIVLGGTASAKKVMGNLTIQGTGTRGIASLVRGLRISEQVMRAKKIYLIVAQDPHATGWIGMRLKQRFGIPLLVHVHGDFWDNAAWLRESWKHRIYHHVQKKVIAAADMVRAVSDGIREKLIAAQVPSDRIVVINTPVNDAVFAALNQQQKVLLEELRFKYQEKKVLLFCGRLVPAKNVPLLLEAAAALRAQAKGWILVIIGDGSERTKLEGMIRTLHLESYVQLLGPKSPQELVVYYHLALLVALPSTNESFGKVIIEAGMAGTPCLASDTTGARSIITDGNTGFLVPVHDREAFAAVLEEMIEYPEQTKQLGTWAREQYLKKYAAGPTIDRIISLWHSLARL